MIKFLDKKTILEFHENQIELYGGISGIRSEELLESALFQPQANFGGEYICKDIFEMAATYGFHICQNHPFYDGNKRTALIAIYTFLYVNGYRLNANKKGLYAVIIALSKGELDKKELALYLKSNSQKNS